MRNKKGTRSNVQSKKERKGKKKKLQVFKVATLLTFTFYLLTPSVSAQTSVNAAGGDASGNGGSVSYSVGQVVYTTDTGTTGSVAHGVQQPYEISVETGIEATEINLLAIAYPNPTTNYLLLRVEYESLKDLSYQLYDINGKLLQTKELVSTETQIDISSYASATYFVKVTQGNGELKTFKIIKK
ncbi:MAG TPA: T9SS type A sorting domain-containing protein [Salinivirgaceae bacterium]|nr:T9SS type A sorting domain-containing protein [Salinivirgaceae bacterium]